MEISAEQVRILREKTGAGMMDCKKALTEAAGDFDKAIDILRKKGAAVAAKRAERATNEGLILTSVSADYKKAYMIETNSETDFVSSSPDFVEFSKLALESLIKNSPADVEGLLKTTVNGKNIGEELTTLIGKIGEKLQVSRFSTLASENGAVVDYIHHGSKLGVLLQADNVGKGNVAELAALLKDIAMQIAAMKPLCIYREEVAKGVVEKEIEIYKELLRKEGKPEQMLDKIAQGKLNKFYQENCLYEQAFVKDNSKSIKDLIEDYNKKNSSSAKLTQFRRFHLSDETK